MESFQTDRDGLFYSNARNYTDFETLQENGWFTQNEYENDNDKLSHS